MVAQLAGNGGVEHVTRVGGTHLEQDPHLEFAEDLVGEVAVEVVHGVAPRNEVNAQAGTFAEDEVEMIGRSGVVIAAREAEIVFFAAEVSEPGQVVDEEE